MHTDTDAAIRLDAVHKSFRSRGGDVVEAVRGIDLEIGTGEVVAFLGPNGAGKTTTLDMVLGLTGPTSGEVRVRGSRPREAVKAGRVSAVLQTGGLLRDLTVRETAMMIASTFPEHADVDEVLERAGIAALRDRMVSRCSGGEQQRLRFALALLPDPELLILDEPTSGMDVGAQRDFWEAMYAVAEQGRTVLFATHNLTEADSFARRIVMIAAGRVVADGSVPEIRARATGRMVSADLPDGADDELVARIGALDGVVDVTTSGRRVELRSTDSDRVALALLRDLGLRNLEIRAGSLESAFLALTAENPEEAQR